MQKQTSQKIISLEICRFMAAFCVMVDHQISSIASLSPAYAKHDAILGGFDLPPIIPVLFFFVLSGFVMMTAHHQDFGQLQAWPRYIWRRLCRIYPVYWLSLSVYLYFLWPTLTWHYLAGIFTLWPSQTNTMELNSPAWSLRFEVCFYVMFGIALLPVIGRIWLAGWIALVAWHWFPWTLPFRLLSTATGWHPILAGPINGHFFGFYEIYFFAGLLAGFSFVRWQSPNVAHWALFVIGAAALLMFTKLTDWGFIYPSIGQTPFIALSLGAIIFALGALERAGILRISLWWSRFGAMSYPLYMIHPPVIFLMSIFFYYHADMRMYFSPDALFTLLLTISLILTVAVTFLFDRPVQRMLRKLRFKNLTGFFARISPLLRKQRQSP